MESKPVNDLAARRLGRDVAITGGSTQRFFFGPFEAGEGIEALMLYLQAQAATAIGTSRVVCEVSLFATLPPDSTAGFAVGRPVTSAGGVGLPLGAASGAATLVQSLGPGFELPFRWICDGSERFLGVQLTEAAGGVDVKGSLWMKRRW